MELLLVLVAFAAGAAAAWLLRARRRSPRAPVPGPAPSASAVLAANFGPVNSDGGERRLNVLITRARRRCEVFTNITDEDIPATSASLGVRALRTFLHYARTSEFPVDTQVGGEPASPFEEAVLDALRRSGYTVHCQVGSAGYFIDLAVVDPEQPGSYLLAIECDGASYHSARSSRDRDRLRQQVLEGLGWTFHRIWSTDWFADPDAELKRAIAAIEQAKERRSSAPPVRVPFTSPNGDHIQRGEPTPITDGPSVPTLEPYEIA
jgi:very-short-patch-repair endonuclease